MIRKLILTCFLAGGIPLLGYNIQAQTYTVESKNCGSCGEKVSNNSRVEMRCPHCGVVWGSENQHRTYKGYIILH